MSTFEAAVLASVLLAAGPHAPDRRYGIGQPVTEQDLAAWDIDVRPDGKGLPPGRGTVAEGKAVYLAKCSGCHGEDGQGSPMDRLAGGEATLATQKPVKTVGSYWPYATTLFDYLRRTMPFTDPQGLSADDTYAVTAYVLYLNRIVPESASMDAVSLPRVKMPNRNGFVRDARPDVR